MKTSSTIPAGTRILIVVGSWELGGSERQALELAKLLRERFQAEVALWALVGDSGSLLDLATAANLSTRSLNCGQAAQTWGKLGVLREVMAFAAAVRRWKPDVLWLFTLMPNVWCQWIRPFCNMPRVVWNQRDLGIGWRNTFLERLALRRAKTYLANSPAVRDFLHEQWQVPMERIHLLPNAVSLAPPQLTRTEWRARWNVAENDMVMVMPARLDSAKDHATLLTAWQQVQQALPTNQRAILVLAGREGETAVALRTQAEQLGITDTVQFPGAVADIADLLAAADLGVYSSRSEGCPNGVLECLAAGLPIVATDIPGIRFAVGTELVGQLVVPGDVQALSNLLQQTILARDQHLRLAELGKQQVAEQFSPAALAAAIARFWNSH